MIDPMFLDSIQKREPAGPYAGPIGMLESSGQFVPHIMRLFAFKPEATGHLSRYTQAVMRGPSPLAPGFRELIAAYTSKLNHCPF